MGSDSNVKSVQKENYDYISIHLEKEEISKLEIIEYGYDLFSKKYFSIVKVSASSDKYIFNAKLMIFLCYNNGWELSEKIGVINANFLVN